MACARPRYGCLWRYGGLWCYGAPDPSGAPHVPPAWATRPAPRAPATLS